MRLIKLHEAAELEIAEAIAYYEENGEGLGTALREAVENVIDRVTVGPLGFPVIHGSNIRRALTQKFPYSVIFRIDEDLIFIVAIFHSSRNPMIWRGRID